MNCPHGHEGARDCTLCQSFVRRTAPKSLAIALSLSKKLDSPEVRAMVRELVETLCVEIEAHYAIEARDTRLSLGSLIESALRPFPREPRK
jgi:hypothetical protein